MTPPPQTKRPAERTLKVRAPAFHRSGKAWRKFTFDKLEKVSRTQMLLARRLDWLVPGLVSSKTVSESVGARLKELFDEEVSLSVDYLHVIVPRQLRKYVGDPTFLAVLAPMPHKTRGFLEVELSLAHAAIDMLLGGGGEAVSLRRLTDIEEGVMSYVILEALKAMAPSLDPGMPRLRLEGLCHSVDEAMLTLSDEPQVAVLQLKSALGPVSGYLRLFVPASVLGMINPPEGEVRRAKRAAELGAHRGRLALVKTWLRAEIGTVDISSADLTQLAERDVVLVDQLMARPDRAEGGRAHLRLGWGRAGRIDADVFLEDNRFKAKITGFALGEDPSQARADDEGAAEELSEHGDTHPGESQERDDVNEGALKEEGAELLNDIPLQIAVELARVSVSAEEVMSLQVGQVLDLNKVPGEPVDLSVNGKVIAHGELVEVEGHLGVRVLSLTG